ncbi:hypothetical protein BJY59DRAFT_717384 [Rhodotorula toruloides]
MPSLTKQLAQLVQTLLGSTHNLLAAYNFQHSDTPKQLCGLYIMLNQAHRDLIKAEEALFNLILAAILTKNDFKRMMAQLRSMRSS